MTWNLPDEETRRRVNAAFGGTDPYLRLQSVWLAALDQLPTKPFPYWETQQLRTKAPEDLVGVDPAGKASEVSGHYLGLQRDVDWSRWPLAHKRQVVSILEQAGLAVEKTKKGKLFRRHLHYGIPSAVIKEKGLVPMIEQIVRTIRATRDAGRMAGRFPR